MAKRGIKTMPLYGPMKPVGLEYPEDYKGPRDERIQDTLRSGPAPSAVTTQQAASTQYRWNFQTHLKWGEQKRVFQMIPCSENA